MWRLTPGRPPVRPHRADQLADFHRLIEASCVTYARQLASGQVRVTASDLVGLIKISMQLYGEPNPALTQALRERGATVLELTPYVWDRPVDPRPILVFCDVALGFPQLRQKSGFQLRFTPYLSP